MLQIAIAKKLQVTQPEVSRLLRIAKDERWLQTAPTVVRSTVPDSLWERVDREFFGAPEDLEQRVNAWGKKDVPVRVQVVSAADRESFGLAAAQPVAGILDEADVVGIMWGLALASMIGGIAQGHGRTRARATRLRVVPLCGEPFFEDGRGGAGEASSSKLARDLDLAVNGQQDASEGHPSLLGVPVYIPTSFNEADRKVLNRYLALNPGYREIYGTGRQKGLIKSIQTIITGVGGIASDSPSNPRTGVFIAERLKHEEMSGSRLGRLSYGDFGGILLPRKGILPEEKRAVERLNRGWTGASFEQLEECAREGAKSARRHGVVVLADGAGKAELIREIVRLGVVNELIIGHELAAALDELGRNGSGNG